jgi:hypothetical protein
MGSDCRPLLPRPRPSPLAPAPALALLLALATAPRAARAQSTGPNFDYPYTSCALPGASTKLAAGDRTTLCVNFNGATMGVFNVVVDQFAAISLQGSNVGFPAGSGYIREGSGPVPSIFPSSNSSENRAFYQTFDVAVLGAFSAYPRIYKRLAYSLNERGDLSASIATFPLFTAIVTLTDGTPTAIAWDDGCLFCAENTPTCGLTALNANSSSPMVSDALRGCSQPMEACYSKDFNAAAGVVSAAGLGNSSNATNVTASALGAGGSNATNATLANSPCDLKVFVVWTGSDARGNYLTSVNKRFSRFRQFNIATAYQSALDVASQGVDLANTAVSRIQQVPGQIGIGGDRGAGVGRRLAGEGGEGVEGAEGAGAGAGAAPPG